MPSLYRSSPRLLAGLLLLLLLSACSVRQLALQTIGDSLASGGSAYTGDDDPELIGAALPANLKLLDSLILEAPTHSGLLLAASRAYLLYAYGYVHFAAEQAALTDPERARNLRRRARKLDLRAYRYAARALELRCPGTLVTLRTHPEPNLICPEAAAGEGPPPVPELYWTAAELGLTISVSRDKPPLLARLPEVEALLLRALQLDESWNAGTLHEFWIALIGARDPRRLKAKIRAHFERALVLSRGRRPSLYVTLAETEAISRQDRREFRALLNKALAIDPDTQPDQRLTILLSQRRARWLLQNIDQFIL